MNGIRAASVAVAWGFIALGLASCAVSSPPRRPVGQPTPPPADGAINLLDAAHAPLWKQTRGGADVFAIKNGVMHIPGTFGALKYVGYMGEEFGDFRLHVEFKTARGVNSGIVLRSQPPTPHKTGLEIQILDSHGQDPDTHSCGAVYDVVTPMFEVTNPAGEWNSFDITEQGTRLVVVENGWKIIDTDLSLMTMLIGKFDTPYAQLPRKGYLFLQDHHGEIWFRNLYVRKL